MKLTMETIQDLTDNAGIDYNTVVMMSYIEDPNPASKVLSLVLDRGYNVDQANQALNIVMDEITALDEIEIEFTVDLPNPHSVATTDSEIITAMLLMIEHVYNFLNTEDIEMGKTEMISDVVTHVLEQKPIVLHSPAGKYLTIAFEVFEALAASRNGLSEKIAFDSYFEFIINHY